MNNTNQSFCEKLLRMEEISPDLKEKYEKEIKNMFKKKLSKTGKWLLMISLLLISAYVVFQIGLILLLPFWQFTGGVAGRSATQWYIKNIGGLFCGILWVIVSAWILRRGMFNKKIHIPLLAFIGWCLVISIYYGFKDLLLLEVQHIYPEIFISRDMVSFLLMGVIVALICFYINYIKFKMQERILEIEYRVSELAEKVET